MTVAVPGISLLVSAGSGGYTYAGMRTLVCGIVAACICAPKSAGAAELSVSVDRNVVSLDDRLVLSVEVSGAGQGSAPELPPLDGFAVAHTERSTQIQIANFQMTTSARYDYTLVPLKAGRLVIGPVTLREGDREQRTPPITVEVLDRGRPVPPSPPPSGAGRPASPAPREPDSAPGAAPPERMFIEIEADKTNPWLREQVILTFRFCYADVALADQPVYEAPPAHGFVEKQLGDGRSVNSTRVINGRRYLVSELKTALYPYRTGELAVGPARLKGNILADSPRRARPPRGFFDMDDFFGDPFFGGFVKKPFSLVSNELKIDVRPLPKEGAPEGEVPVGRYRLAVEAKPREVRAGDPVTLTMTLTGEGDLERVPPPRVRALDGFKSYEPTGSVSAGGKTFEQAIVPLDEKITEIPPVIFTYFDPGEGRYVTLKEGPVPLKVLPPQEGNGKIVSLPSAAGGRDVQLIERNIVFIKTSPGTLKREAATEAPGVRFWLLQAVPLIAVAAAAAHARHRSRLRSDRGYARLHRAGRATRARLKSVERAMRKGNAEEFYGGIAKAVSGYVADRLNMPAGGMTPDLVREALASRGVDPGLIRRLDELYRTCDLARFAPSGAAGNEMAHCHGEATGVLEELRRGRW